MERARKAAQALASSLPLLAAVALGPILVTLAAKDGLAALVAFGAGPVSSAASLFAFLDQSAILAICALGAALAFRSGSFNLGGEGQAYSGGLCAVLAGLAIPGLEAPWSLALGLGAGALGGALVAAPSALGKRFAEADVLLSSFLVSQTAILLVDWLIGGPLRDPESNLMATRALARAQLRGSGLGVELLAPIAALLLALGLALMLARSRGGRELALYGDNPVFARSVGLPVGALSLWPLLAAGALHGLAGAFIALGGAGRAVRGMSGGIGWTAIGASLVATHHPILVLPASLLLGWLDSGARQAAVLAGVPFDASSLVKGLILLFATAKLLPILLKGRRLR